MSSGPPLEEGVRAGALRLDFDRVERDVAELAAMERGSAAQDKPQVAWLERRLRDAGAHQVQVETFRVARREA